MNDINSKTFTIIVTAYTPDGKMIRMGKETFETDSWDHDRPEVAAAFATLKKDNEREQPSP